MIIPGKSWNKKGNGWLNLLKTIPLLYPELFPGFTWDPSSTSKSDIRMSKAKLVELLRGTQPMSVKSALLDFPGDFQSPTNMYAVGIHPLLSLPTATLEKVLVDQFKMKHDHEDKCLRQCMCGMREFELTGTMGVTAGMSQVGFCSPDTNPFQINRVRTTKWAWERKGGRCEMTKQEPEDVTTLTFAIYHYLALDFAWNMRAARTWPSSIQIRVRVPSEVTLVEAEDPTDFIQKLSADIDGFHGSWLNGAFEGSADGTKDKGLTKELAPMVAKFRDLFDSVGLTSRFVKSIATGFTGMFSKTQLQSMAESIVSTASPASVSQTTLTGFNIKIDFEGTSTIVLILNSRLSSLYERVS